MIGSLDEALDYLVRESGITRSRAVSLVQDARAASPSSAGWVTSGGCEIRVLAAGIIGQPPRAWRYAVEVKKP